MVIHVRQRLLLWIVCIILLAFSVSAWERSDFLQHVETKVDITEAYTHYRVCNPTAQDYVITTDTARRFDVGFNKVRGDLTDYHFELWKNVSVDVTVLDYGLVEHSYVCSANFNYTLSPKYAWCYENGTNGTVILFEHNFSRGNVPAKTIWWNETEQTGSHVESVLREQWTAFSPLGKTFQSGRCYDVKVVGKYKASTEGVAIDNVITYQNISFDEYAWWNSTWQYKYAFNVTAVSYGPYYPFRLVFNSTYVNMSFCQSDGGDVRIVNSTEDGVVDFNLSSWTPAQGIVYVNDSINVNKTYYFYCNASAAQTTTSKNLDYLLLANNLVSAWEYNDGTADDTLGLNDGTVTGAVQTNTSCKIRGCYNFDGLNDHIAISNSSSLRPSYWTITTWMKRADTNDGGCLANKGYPAAQEHGWGLYVHDNTVNNKLQGFVTTGANAVTWHENQKVLETSWIFAAMSYNGTHIIICKNDSCNATAKTDAMDWTGSYEDLWFGERADGSWDFNGSIDDTYFYNASLNSTLLGYLYRDNASLSYPFYAQPAYAFASVTVLNSAPVLVLNTTSPASPVYGQNVSLNVTFTEPENDTIVWANFSLVAKNGTVLINSVNGTCSFTDASLNRTLCFSSSYYINASVWNETDGFGTWNWTYSIDDNSTEAGALTGAVGFVLNNTDGPSVSVTGPSGTIATKAVTASYSVSRIIKDALLYCFANVTYSTNMSALAEGSINCSATSVSLGNVATDGDYIVYVRAVETKNGVNYTNFSSSSFTVNTAVIGGGGGGSAASSACNIDVVSPLSQISIYGSEGLMSKAVQFSVKNKGSATSSLSYSLSAGISEGCTLNKTSGSVDGGSVVSNTVSCLVQKGSYSGKITVEADGGKCSASVNVVVKSSVFSKLFDFFDSIFSFQVVTVGGVAINAWLLGIIVMAFLVLVGALLVIAGAG